MICVEYVELDGFGVILLSLNGNVLGVEIDDFGVDVFCDFMLISGFVGLVFDLGNDVVLGGIV